MTLGYQLTETVRLYAGYNFLYWTNVARPGAQIDRNLDVGFLGGALDRAFAHALSRGPESRL